MGKLTEEEVLHVAKLSSLSLSKEEVERFSRQLSEVIEYFNQLSEVQTETVVPTSQTTGLENKLREDEVNSVRILSQEDVLSESSKEHSGYFVVPALLNKDND